MPQITTTNRQAILELISQADETTEVAGLSASVTELQIEVAGLSASIAGLTGGGDLQTVTDSGNTTTNDIQLIDDAEVIFGATGGILFNNSSRLREGTIDAGYGGNKGIAQICAVGYEMKWEAGSLYIMNGDGTEIREVRYTFGSTPSVSDDDTKGFTIDSRWVLDNGDVYVCSDNSTGDAVWSLIGIQSSTASSVISITDEINITNQFISPSNGIELTQENIEFSKTNFIKVKQTRGNVLDVDNFTGLPIIGYANTTQSFSAATTTGVGTGLLIDITFDNNGDLDSYNITDGGKNYISLDSVTTNNLGSGTITFEISLIDKSNIDMNVELDIYTTEFQLTPGQLAIATSDGSSTVSALQTPISYNMIAINSVNSAQIVLNNQQVELTTTDGTNTSTLNIAPTNITSITTDGNITDTISLDPQGLGNGTGIKSEDITSGYNSRISFNPSNIVTEVADGIGTQSTIDINSIYANISSSDGTDTSFIDMNKDVLVLQSDNLSTGKTSIITLDPNNVSGDGSYLYTADAIGTQSQIKFSLGGITNEYINGVNEAILRLQKDNIGIQITDGTDTSGVTIEPKIFDATWTDGTKANTFYHEYNPFSEMQFLEMFANNGTSLTTAVSLSQDANSSQIRLEAGDRGYDGTTYSTIFLQESQVLVEKVYDGYTHRLEFYNTGAIDLLMTDGISTSGGFYVEPNMTSVNCGGTAGSTSIILNPTTISMNGIPAFDDDADASTLSAGDLYQTTGLGASPLDVAGILMIKQ
jgi:hypothetical protein